MCIRDRSYGIMINELLDAAEVLEQEGISAEVIQLDVYKRQGLQG